MKKLVFAAAVCFCFSPFAYGQMSLVPATSSDSQAFNDAVQESHEAAQAETHEQDDNEFNHAVGLEVEKAASVEGQKERDEHSDRWSGELKENEEHGEQESSTIDDSNVHDGAGVVGTVRGGDDGGGDGSAHHDN